MVSLVQQLIHLYLLHLTWCLLEYLAVPTAPPANLTVTAVTSRTVNLSWDPPPYAGQNGVIQQYVLTVNRSDTNFFTELTTASTQLTVEHIFPFRVYLFAVAAKTIQLGPFSDEVSVLLLEDGKVAQKEDLGPL